MYLFRKMAVLALHRCVRISAAALCWQHHLCMCEINELMAGRTDRRMQVVTC